MARASFVVSCVFLFACGSTADPVTTPDAGPSDAGSADAAPVTSTSDAGPADAAVTPGSGVTLSPDGFARHVFAPTLAGTTTFATVTITAHEAVTGLAAHVTRAGYSIVSSDCPAALDAGASCDLHLAFFPQNAGSYDGEENLVVVFHTASAPAQIAAPLGGSGIVPEPAAGPVMAQSSYRVPATVLGETGSLEVPVVNTGLWPMSLDVTVNPGAPDFTITVDPACAGGILPGEACALDVSYRPSAWGCSLAFFKVNALDPWTIVRGCAARREERGRALLDGIGRLARDGDGFVFTAEAPEIYPFPPPAPGEIYRLRADGTFDPGFGKDGRLLVGSEHYFGQRVLPLAPGRLLWLGTGAQGGGDGTDLALVSGGVAGDVVHVDGCNAAAVAVNDAGAIALLCGAVAETAALLVLHPDLTADEPFGRPQVFDTSDGPGLFPASVSWDAGRARWLATAFNYDNVHVHMRVSAVGADGTVDVGYHRGDLPFNYALSAQALPVVGADGSLLVPGVVESSPDDLLTVAKLGPDGRLDAAFAGGTVSLPLDRSDDLIGSAPLVALAPAGADEVTFLVQVLRFVGNQSTQGRWLGVGCDAHGVCHEDERMALGAGALRPISLVDGDRFLSATWSHHQSFNWFYPTVALAAVRGDGTLDPTFANDDDVTGDDPGGVAPWRVRADGSGRFYVAAHDVFGERRQPRVTRYDATGTIDPGFSFTLPAHEADSVELWDLAGGSGGEVLNGRNLDLVVDADGSGVLASLDGNAHAVTLAAFTAGGAADAGFGTGGQVTLAFPLDADAMQGGPFGVALARLDDGSLWVSVNASVGLVRHVSAEGAPMADWQTLSTGPIGALLAMGSDVIVFQETGGTRILSSGAMVSVGGVAGPNSAAAAAPDGGYYLATSCVWRFTPDGLPADGLDRPLFGDRGQACVDGNPYDAPRALVVRADGTLDLFTTSHHTHLAADGQVLDGDPFAPEMVRDVAIAPAGTLVVGRDAASRLLLGAGF